MIFSDKFYDIFFINSKLLSVYIIIDIQNLSLIKEDRKNYPILLWQPQNEKEKKMLSFLQGHFGYFRVHFDCFSMLLVTLSIDIMQRTSIFSKRKTCRVSLCLRCFCLLLSSLDYVYQFFLCSFVSDKLSISNINV